MPTTLGICVRSSVGGANHRLNRSSRSKTRGGMGEPAFGGASFPDHARAAGERL